LLKRVDVVEGKVLDKWGKIGKAFGIDVDKMIEDAAKEFGRPTMTEGVETKLDMVAVEEAKKLLEDKVAELALSPANLENKIYEVFSKVKKYGFVVLADTARTMKDIKIWYNTTKARRLKSEITTCGFLAFAVQEKLKMKKGEKFSIYFELESDQSALGYCENLDLNILLEFFEECGFRAINKTLSVSGIYMGVSFDKDKFELIWI
jgi:hypothetical protein